MRRKSLNVDSISTPKYKYSFNDKTYDLSLSQADRSLINKLGVFQASESSLLPDKIKSSSNFTLQKIRKSSADNE